MKQLSIGVMGCASIAKRSVIPAILELQNKFKIVAVSSRTKEKAEEFANEFNTQAVTGYDTLLADKSIDAIYMPLPTGLHEEWIEAALHAGKHVLAEKSLAVDHASASKLVQLAEKKGLLLMENFMFRNHVQHQWIWERYNNNELGELRLFRSQFGFPPLDKSNFRYDAGLGGGALLDAGAYTVKASQWFLGQNLEVAAATLYVDGKGTDIYGNATLQNEKGQIAQVSFGFDNAYQCNYEIWGSKGKLLAKKAFTPRPAEQPAVEMETPKGTETVLMQPDNHFVRTLETFHSAVVNNEYKVHLQEVLSQSRILTDIRNNSRKVKI